jgi:hypothetical protein
VKDGRRHHGPTLKVSDGLDGAFEVSRVDEIGDVPAGEFVPRVPELAQGSRVAVGHEAVSVEEDDQVALSLEHHKVEITQAVSPPKIT